MIFSFIPTPYAPYIDVNGKSCRLVVDTASKRIAIWYPVHEWNNGGKMYGYRELMEVTPENVEELPPFFIEYVRRWWDKWGIVHQVNQNP